MEPFRTTWPSSGLAPVLISVPHCGTRFPDTLRDEYVPRLIEAPDDTDWFVDMLYDFTTAMGMPMVSAVYSRWVIDLNRDPESTPLYTDGRIITGLCPVTTFLGEPLYRDRREQVTAADVTQRVESFYKPYHREIETQLAEMKARFGQVLLWDCHSIRQTVPTIRAEKFPDLILGSADETSASGDLVSIALDHLHGGGYTFQHNHPFKGGYITRNYGRPASGVHALQLEMSKVNYMDDDERQYDKARASRMRELLQRTLAALAERLTKS